MNAREALGRYRTEIRRLIATTGCRNPRIFGSVARGDDTATSDLDILVDEADVDFFDVCGMQERISMLTGVPVHVLMDSELSAPMKQRILAEAIPL